MKIALVSDEHLEFTNALYDPSNPDNADVLIMAGDMILIDYLRKSKYVEFFEKYCDLFKNVILINGNHSSYHYDIDKVYSDTKKYLGHIKNLHLLENESIKIGNIRFIGTTLWSDMNKEDPITMMTVQSRMNDYHLIRKGTKTFLPENAVELFKKAKEFIIWEMLKYPEEDVIVCTHMAPSFKCISEEYKREYHLNGAYASDLDQFILNRPRIRAWVSGHIHHPFDFYIGNTRILNNARGYVGRERGTQKDDPYYPKTFEV